MPKNRLLNPLKTRKSSSNHHRREVIALFFVDVLRYIMNIFYGPFLSMYFFKISNNTVNPISIYSLMAYTILGLVPTLLGIFIKQKHQLTTLRTGVILNFVYILFIFIAREHIVDHLPLLALLFGTSTAFYYYPHNMISGDKITKDIRANYELAKKVIISVAGATIPFLLGLFITTTDFHVATIVILILSIIQIVCSLLLKPISGKKQKFTFGTSLRALMKHKTLRSDFLMVFFAGLLTSDSAMQVILPLLIYNFFQTDLNLGIIASVTNLLVTLISFLYLKVPKIHQNKWFLFLFALVPIAGLFAFLTLKSDMTLVLYYIGYTLMAELMQLIIHIKLYNVASLPVVKKGHIAEYWAFSELAQALGRIVSFALLLVASLVGGMPAITILFATLTFGFFPYIVAYQHTRA